MALSGDEKDRRSTFYEKTLVADTFLIIGCILLSFGLGLSFYNVPVVAEDSVASLTSGNSYTQDFSITLSQGDSLLLGVKPYSLANLSTVLYDTSSQPVLILSSGLAGSLLNLSYTATATGNYVLRVFENLTDPRNHAVECEIETMGIRVLTYPDRPYLIYGVALILCGVIALFYSRKSGLRSRNMKEWYERRSLALPYLFLISSIGFSLLFALYSMSSPSQMGIIVYLLLVAFPAINVFSLIVGITTLREKPLSVFLSILYVGIAIWASMLSILVYFLPSVFIGSMSYWTPDVFLRTMQALSRFNSIFYQTLIFVVIIILAYCLTVRYGQHRIYSSQLDVEAAETSSLKGLSLRLENAIARKNLEEFFSKLKEENLEASVFLYFLLADHVDSGAKSFNYYQVISDRREIFSKDIYEREPVGKILQPLGYIRVAGKSRFKTYRFRINSPLVSRLISTFRESSSKVDKETIQRWAGVDLLKERRMRYSGLLKDKDSSIQ